MFEKYMLWLFSRYLPGRNASKLSIAIMTKVFVAKLYGKTVLSVSYSQPISPV